MFGKLMVGVVVLVLVGAANASAERIPGPEGKLSTQLRDLAATHAAGGSVQAQANADRLDVDSADRVLVDVFVQGDAGDAARRLRDAGMEVTAASNDAPVPMVEGRIPVAQLGAVAGLDVSHAIQQVAATGTDDQTSPDVGAVTSEGDIAHRGPQARALGFNGAGIKVGVISDSINRVAPGVAGSQATGDLPANVQLLADGQPGDSDEGRAMAEIIYDTAPGMTNMAFATGGGGPVNKASNIGLLQTNGAQIIADDIFYLEEPFFQDGVVARAVDTARGAGVNYFASAGNRARQSWEGTYADSGTQFNGSPLNNFGAGTTTQSVATVNNGASIQVELQWDEAFGQAATDIDAFLVDPANPNTVLASGTNDNIASGNPSELITWVNNTGAPRNVGLRITRFAGARNPFMKWIGFGGTYNIVPNTASDAINPDAAAAQGSLAVAAIRATQPGLNQPEPFSSRGLKTRLFDASGNRFANPLVLQKPALAGADGVNTSVPGFQPFFGTSAATPSASGVATLVKSANPGMSTNDLATVMTNPANTIACSTPNPGADCGAGFILADRAVAQAIAMRSGGGGVGGGGGGGGGGSTSTGSTSSSSTTTSTQPPATAPPAVSNAFTVAGLKSLKDGSIQVDLNSPGAGAYVAQGTFSAKSRLAQDARKRKRKRKTTTGVFGTAAANAAAAAPVTLIVRPSAKARAALRRTGRLSVSLSVSFTPKGGSPSTQIRTVSVRKAKAGKKRRRR